MANRPKFSLLHATKRFSGSTSWVVAWKAWSMSCWDGSPSNVEYVLAVHRDDVETAIAQVRDCGNGLPVHIVAFDGPDNSTAAFNAAAAVSTGTTLIIIADDLFPSLNKTPHCWDAALGSFMSSNLLDGEIDEFIIHVSTASPADATLITHPIVSRELYDRWGYVLYPGYESVYADNDITEHGQAEGLIFDARDAVKFEHRHLGIAADAVYKKQNRAEAYESGARLLQIRRANGFKPVTVTPPPNPGSLPVLAVCLPGDMFSGTWLSHWTALLCYLLPRFIVQPIICYSSNVYATRAQLARSLRDLPQTPDYVLWVDDDNLVTASDFNALYGALTAPASPADIVAGWCYCQVDDYSQRSEKVSCGWLDENGVHPVKPADMAGIFEVDYTGFPAVLMKYSAIVAAGPHPFLPLMNDRYENGMSGEDVAFCSRARAAGARIFVHSGVKVPHMKRRNAEPMFIDPVSPVPPISPISRPAEAQAILTDYASASAFASTQIKGDH